MERKEKVSIIVPNYDGKKYLQMFLPGLFKILCKGDEIIVVDNGSRDESVEFLKRNYPEVKVIKLPENKGFGIACNIGAKNSNNEFILFLNNDIRIIEDFITPLIEFLKKEDIFSVYPSIRVPKRNREEGRKRRLFRFNMYKGAMSRTEKYGEIGYAIYPPGCCFLTKKETFLTLGGFDEIFSPCYWEDIDIGYRAWRRGLKTLYVPKFSVIHEEGKTTGFFSPFYLKTVSVRNKLIFIWKNYSDPFLLFRHFISLIFKTYEALIKRQKWFLAGLWEAIKKRKDIFKKRNNEKKHWKYSDRRILRLIDSFNKK